MPRKILLLLLCCLLLVATPMYAQTNCADYQLLRENAAYELLTYNQKDKQTGRVTYQVKDINRNDGKVEATIQSQVYDEKGEMATEGEFRIGCDNGSIWMDMQPMMNQTPMGDQQSMDMTMEGDKMLYPSNLQAGQKLEDGTMTMEMKGQGSAQSMMTMVMKITNRTVEAKEKVQVPAGSFDSYKIRYNTEMENRAMGMKMPGMRMETVEYYVPEIGVVRSENYRNGKLMSYSVLSKIK
ncbi:TapB family protein [Pontibacter mangrovi]|uniref:DUF3108 domain-containing protein n=1 Tax=Pontibacter mangrovi TaxID=2589816 RepID=A0A501VZ29_9BACT|nr:hypothetical protein [Pontibacter mangrovi]TPE42679.1 hypothetical protein FJM65_16580 [Pontibacter mangrovi]